MRIYTVYHKDFAPDALMTKYPQVAKYADDVYYLFAESLEQVTGTPALDIVDLAALGLQEDDAEGELMTKSQLDAQIGLLMQSEATGKEVQLSLPQGRHLYETIFNTESEEI